jgi:monovalent cation:H+ antiporter-2, CPA2 family
MEHMPILRDLTVIIAVGMAVAVALSLLRLPTAAGLLAAGALMGPSGFGLVESIESIHTLAEIGVILLLFSIGLEFSLDRLARIAGLVAVGGALQVGLTVAATMGIALGLGYSMEKAVLFGFIVSLSSTAIVLRSLTERGEIDAPHGRFIIGALLFQDLAVVPMMLVIPLLGGDAGKDGAALPILIALGKAAGVVVATMLVARRIVPVLFQWVDRARSREVFLLAVLSICIATAWLTSMAGLSLALGAFLGGIVVAGTVYGSRALGDILPLRDVFMSVFFVSLGMLFDPAAVVERPLVIALLVVGFVLGKATLAAFAALAMRFPARVAFLSGLGLGQFSEFGFVLVNVAAAAGVVTITETREILAAGILSMFLTPVVVMLSPRLAAGARLLRPLERLIGVRGIDECDPQHEHITGHVLVVGYGVAGRLLSDALAAVDVPYLVLELNADAVRKAAAEGQPIYYGDVTNEEALHHARAAEARAAVILINDREAAARAVDTLRRVAPSVPILLRTRYLSTGPQLIARGASDVVFEEVEAGVEMLGRVLRKFDVPLNLLVEQLERARTATQASPRAPWVPRKRLGEVADLDDLKIEKILVRDGDHGAGRTALDLDLRRAAGALAVAIRREGALIANPDPREPFRPGDAVYLVGSRQQISAASQLLTRGGDPAVASEVGP